jgi:hypothetical protein
VLIANPCVGGKGPQTDIAIGHDEESGCVENDSCGKRGVSHRIHDWVGQDGTS